MSVGVIFLCSGPGLVGLVKSPNHSLFILHK